VCDGQRVRCDCKQGNKGAAALRLRLYDSTLCFVCSHLAAHQNNVAGRNADFANIVSKVEFRNDGVVERCACCAIPGAVAMR
jgi:hypothetical protein